MHLHKGKVKRFCTVCALLGYTCLCMPHGHYMRGTRLDYIIVFGLVLALIFIITLAINPVRALSSVKDERRSDDVRRVMAAVLQLSLDNPEKYQALVERTDGRGGEKFMLGNGQTCAGDWGAYCKDAAVADDCLPTDEIFSDESTIPIDPDAPVYGDFGTGYYLSLLKGELEVGSCGATTGAIRLKTLVK